MTDVSWTHGDFYFIILFLDILQILKEILNIVIIVVLTFSPYLTMYFRDNVITVVALIRPSVLLLENKAHNSFFFNL